MTTLTIDDKKSHTFTFVWPASTLLIHKIHDALCITSHFYMPRNKYLKRT